ncbi:MAG: isoprenylcysteine carboxylmethyltransferase family protein [Acidobacteria bacterium]|nr:MAG: isoprenylcysteine carboxylmethyltransferase family protein [Acidobacteriota bacterium]
MTTGCSGRPAAWPAAEPERSAQQPYRPASEVGVTSSGPKAPRVLIPPPVLFVAALLLGVVVHRIVPVAAAPPPAVPLLRLAGLALFVCSGVLAAASFVTLDRHRTTFRTDRPVSALVTSGPFRLTRNPMYLSLMILIAGVSALVNSFWPLALLVPVVVVVQRLAITPEERYLAELYGSAYGQYCRRVRRWL